MLKWIRVVQRNGRYWSIRWYNVDGWWSADQPDFTAWDHLPYP